MKWERLAKLVGGVAVITVGAATETEMEEKKARVRRSRRRRPSAEHAAMHATKAAVEEGIVPGGGVALLRCLKAIEGLKLEGDQKVGADIVRKAVEAPLRWIATNAGVEGSIVLEKVKEGKDSGFGYNAATDQSEPAERSGANGPRERRRRGSGGKVPGSSTRIS